MKVVILAAGQGSRMGVLTAESPRCLLPIGDEVILQRQLRILQENGIDITSVILVTGYKAELLEAYKCRKVYNPEFYCTDNSYSLGLALEQAIRDEEDILVLDGDLVFESEVLSTIINSEEPNCVLVQSERHQRNSTGVRVDASGYAVEIGKHLSTSEWNYTGIMKISCGVAQELMPNLLSKESRKTWYTVPINRQLDQYRFKVIQTSAKILGINTTQDYTLVKEVFGFEKCRVMVTGASGLLGKKLCSILERSYKVQGVSRHAEGKIAAVDCTDYQRLEAYIELNQPNYIVHTAAIADPDTCESAPEKAYAINVEATQNLCRICEKEGIKLVLISTDYVFDGDSNEEYQPDSPREPVNYYGQTKVMAEDLVKQLKDYLIVRIPILYGYNDSGDKPTFVTQVLQSLQQGKEILADHVQVRYPVLIDEIAIAVGAMLAQKGGVVQLSSASPVTKYDWARTIAQVFEQDENLIKPCKAEGQRSRRPMHIKMNTGIADEANVKISELRDGLSIMRKQMNCIFKLIYKSECFKKIYGVTVGDFRYQMGRILAEELDQEIIEAADCVIPVPNSGLYYGMGLAEALKKPYIQALAKNDAMSRSFNIANLENRLSYLRTKMVPIVELIRDKNILLIDEAIFTGTTLRIVSDMLKACGAKRIDICIPTPVCYSRCYQYIQPNRAMLAEEVAVKDMPNYFGVDSVTQISSKTFVSRITQLQSYFCYDCFKGGL